VAIGRLELKCGKKGGAERHSKYIAREGTEQPVGRRGAKRPAKTERLEATGHGNMPWWAARDPSELWRASDVYERVNGTTYREMVISLPRELSPAQWRSLTQIWISQELGELHAYQWAIRVAYASDGLEQPYVHLMLCERRNDGIDRGAQQYFKRYNGENPERGGARKGYLDVVAAVGTGRHKARIEQLKALRGRWEVVCNRALELAGRPERIDMRSNAERGLEQPVERKHSASGWRHPDAPAGIRVLREGRAQRRTATRGAD
jgi:hypothetical protein